MCLKIILIVFEKKNAFIKYDKTLQKFDVSKCLQLL